MKTEKEEVLLRNCKLKLKGESIINHLKYCNDCVLFAATLGGEVDKKINYYERISMSKAIILDACATVAIEEGCDFVEDEIRKIAIEQGKEITFRFSPGYGDLDLSIQESFIQTVEAYKNIGLTVSAHNILIPRKSVTAIIGFTPKDKRKKRRAVLGAIDIVTASLKKWVKYVNFKELLKKKTLIFDGAMGTMLQKMGLKVGELPEILNLLDRDKIINIHKKYIKAGANIITTNTFGANELKLKNSGYIPEEIIASAVNNAKKASEGKEVLIALDIGPIGQLLEPIGTLTFEEAYEIFKKTNYLWSKTWCGFNSYRNYDRPL